MPALTVLTSAVGLGSYVAALLHRDALRDQGHDVEAEVVEGWFTAADRDRHLAHAAAYHRSFRLAQAGRRMARGVQGCFDDVRVAAELESWRSEGRRRFCVWSGYWLPLLERYVAMAPELAVEVELCRIDAIESDSFRVHDDLAGATASELWLWSWERRALGTQLRVPAGPPPAFAERDRRLVVHGGGWGLGTYADALPELAAAGFALDVLAPDAADWDGRGARDRRYVADPAWRAWDRDPDGRLTFPPLGELGADGRVTMRREAAFPPAHLLVRDALAVVSKPGGGTLLDSLAAATPVVLLEPWGVPESRNGALWEALGFGITLERWRATGFDVGVLETLHGRLLAACEDRIPDALELTA